MKLLLSITVLVVVSLCVVAQAPSPCSEAELKVSMAESRAASAEAKAEARALRIETLESESRQQRASLESSQQSLVSAQRNSAELAASREIEQNRAEVAESYKKDLTQQIYILTAERNALLLKISKANGTFLCETLRIGCIQIPQKGS